MQQLQPIIIIGILGPRAEHRDDLVDVWTCSLASKQFFRHKSVILLLEFTSQMTLSFLEKVLARWVLLSLVGVELDGEFLWRLLNMINHVELQSAGLRKIKCHTKTLVDLATSGSHFTILPALIIQPNLESVIPR